MKSLVRLSKTIGLVGGTVLASFFAQSMKVLALPQEQIVQTLQPIPVFTIADEQGAPLVAVGKDEKKITGVFISQQDAQQFFQQLQQQNPELAQKVKVQPVSLGEVFKLSQANEGKADGLNFAYVPMNDEVEAAKKVLSTNGQQYQGGVPLFVAKGGEDQGYLTVQQNNETRIPFFFEKEQLQQMVERFKKEKPDLASSIKIEVVPLESVMATMQESNDEMLGKIVLVPSQESLQFIRSVQPGQGSPQGQGQAPAPQAAPPAQPASNNN
ncbi:hypothetical protein HC931_20150 [Candidatus Gracilibacteria bacterium]|nr:hypothetical protein [Candidatus Gracilibacteria bacterium]